MDPLTHTLVGVTLANAFFKKRFGPETIPILAIAANLPDMDALVHVLNDPAVNLLRRTFGHSLLTFPLWDLMLAFLLQRFYPRYGLKNLWLLCLTGSASHVLFDLINSFGVVLFWPLSLWRAELAIEFVLDPILTALLAFPLLLSGIQVLKVSTERLSRLSLASVAIYLLFCGANRAMAYSLLSNYAKETQIQPDFSYVFPEPLGPHRWHGVLKEKNLYHSCQIYSLKKQVVPKGEYETQLNDPFVNEIRKLKLSRRLEWFFKAPVWSVERDEGLKRNATSILELNSYPVQVNVYDLRFRSPVINKKGVFEFRFQAYPDGRIQRIKRPSLITWKILKGGITKMLILILRTGIQPLRHASLSD